MKKIIFFSLLNSLFSMLAFSEVFFTLKVINHSPRPIVISNSVVKCGQDYYGELFKKDYLVNREAIFPLNEVEDFDLTDNLKYKIRISYQDFKERYDLDLRAHEVVCVNNIRNSKRGFFEQRMVPNFKHPTMDHDEYIEDKEKISKYASFYIFYPDNSEEADFYDEKELSMFGTYFYEDPQNFDDSRCLHFQCTLFVDYNFQATLTCRPTYARNGQIREGFYFRNVENYDFFSYSLN